jgi:hypothetical protein
MPFGMLSGHDYQADAGGRPINALKVAASARSAMKSKVGYSPALEGAFDPRAAASIAELEAQLMAAAETSARSSRPRRKTKKTAKRVAKKSARPSALDPGST